MMISNAARPAGRARRLCMAAAATMAIAAGAAMAASDDESLPDTNWLSYNGTADGQRYSALDQITPKNAGTLAEQCRIKIADTGSFQSGLVQIDGVIYLTTAHDTVAVDATNCKQRWRHVYTPEQDEVFPVNRGVAYANGKLFRGTGDGRLLALDLATGKTVWQQQAGDPKQGEFFSAAPIAWQGLLITGTAGSDWGVRGRIMAYEQETGREVWRFNTIPRGKEPGAETWKERGSARYGGGGSWTHYSIDYSTGEVFVPVGNPAPDIIPGHRPGANLYTDSMLVLDARTGALKWYHQMVSNDGHDLDLGAAPMLYHNAEGEPIAAIGSKNGHLYGVNRETRKRVYDTVITTIENEGVQPTAKGLHICPGVLGGVEWNGPAYDLHNKAVVVGVVDWCSTIFPKPQKFIPGQFMLGGTWQLDPNASGWINSIDGETGKIRWRYHADGPVVAGVTPTAGGVTFSGDMAGNFLALDSATGKPLLKTQTGGALAGGVITYARGGRQYVALTSGNVSRLTFGASGVPTLIIYALGTASAANDAQPATAPVLASIFADTPGIEVAEADISVTVPDATKAPTPVLSFPVEAQKPGERVAAPPAPKAHADAKPGTKAGAHAGTHAAASPKGSADASTDVSANANSPASAGAGSHAAAESAPGTAPEPVPAGGHVAPGPVVTLPPASSSKP